MTTPRIVASSELIWDSRASYRLRLRVGAGMDSNGRRFGTSAHWEFILADRITSLQCLTSRRCGEMVDAKDLKSAAMLGNKVASPFRRHFLTAVQPDLSGLLRIALYHALRLNGLLSERVCPAS